MKNNRLLIHMVRTLLLVPALLVSCALGFEPPQSRGGSVAIRVAASPSARSAVVPPEVMEHLTYTWRLTGTGPEQNGQLEEAGIIALENLAPGPWLIEIAALLDGYPYGLGSTDFTVEPGETVRKTVIMEVTDVTPPADVSGAAATPGDGQLALAWTNPSDPDFDHVEITWDNGGPQTASVPGSPDAPGSHTITGLINDTSYTVILKAVDINGNSSSGSPVSGTPSAATGYTITFDSHGGLAVSPITDNEGTPVNMPENPTRTGYTFQGWFSAASGGTVYTWPHTLNANVTMHAQWTAINYQEMVSLSGGTVTGDAAYGSGVFPAGRTVTLSPFKMAKYETTYELWYEVYQWAGSNGYTFANPGREGHDGTDGAAPTADKTEPVTTINWRDAIVWCNAYSEMSGKDPVYYADNTWTTVLRVSTNDSGTGTPADGAVMKPGADGYRLPTEAEWEYAARGGVPGMASPFTDRWAGTDTGSDLGDYAWYDDNSFNLGSGHPDYGTNPAGTKFANAAGLYDMSGNVWEWCWDWYEYLFSTGGTDPAGSTSGTTRVFRGGGWSYDSSTCTVAYRLNINPDYRLYVIGFRLVCAP